MAGCNGCGESIEVNRTDPASIQQNGTNAAQPNKLNFDLAIMYMTMCCDMLTWLNYQPLEPCECEKGEILKSKMVDIQQGISEAFDKI